MNSMKVKNIEKKIREFSDTLVNFEDQFVIVPFLPSGYTAYSNYGELSSNYESNEFETYKRLWTGNDAFIITWKDSIQFDYANQNSTDATTDEINIKFQVGEHFLGYMEGYDTENEITQDTSFTDYKSQKNTTTFTFRINASKYELDDDYAYYFYKIPEVSNQVLFKCSNFSKEYIGRDLVCYTITLESLQDQLANTGRAKQQNVMPNAPGQGYLTPIVQDKSYLDDYPTYIEGKDYSICADNKRVVLSDYSKRANNPVKYVVLKLFGLAIVSWFTCIGRRALLGGDYTSYGSPRILFIRDFETATTTTLYRTQQAETNFFWGCNIYPEISFYSSVFSRLQSFLDFNRYWNAQGLLKFDEDATTATNPKVDSVYNFQIYGQEVASGEYKTWNFTVDEKTVNTSYTYGCASTYTVGGTKDIHDHMFDAYWTQKQIGVMPLNKTNTLNYGWTVASSAGLAASGKVILAAALFAIGILATLLQKSTTPKYQGIYGLVPASLFEFMVAESDYTIQSGGYTNLNYFMNGDPSESPYLAYFQTNTMNTSFAASLTDVIEKGGKSYTTDMIGQSVDSDGNNIFSDGSTLLMDGTYTLGTVDNEDTGFIIDSFCLQAIFKGDFSVEFLDKNKEVVWSGVYQSEAKWTDSIREINTWKDTSIFGREQEYVGKPLSYPKALASLSPIESDTSIYLSTQPTFSFNTFFDLSNTQEQYSGNVIDKAVAGVVGDRSGGSWKCLYQRNQTSELSKWFSSVTKASDSWSYTCTSDYQNVTNNLVAISNFESINNIASFLAAYNKMTLTLKYGLAKTNLQASNYSVTQDVSIEFEASDDDLLSTKWVELTYETSDLVDKTQTNSGNDDLYPTIYSYTAAETNYVGPGVYALITQGGPISYARFAVKQVIYKLADYSVKAYGTWRIRLRIIDNTVYVEIQIKPSLDLTTDNNVTSKPSEIWNDHNYEVVSLVSQELRSHNAYRVVTSVSTSSGYLTIDGWKDAESYYYNNISLQYNTTLTNITLIKG